MTTAEEVRSSAEEESERETVRSQVPRLIMSGEITYILSVCSSISIFHRFVSTQDFKIPEANCCIERIMGLMTASPANGRSDRILL